MPSETQATQTAIPECVLYHENGTECPELGSHLYINRASHLNSLHKNGSPRALIWVKALEGLFVHYTCGTAWYTIFSNWLIEHRRFASLIIYIQIDWSNIDGLQPTHWCPIQSGNFRPIKQWYVFIVVLYGLILINALRSRCARADQT